MTLKDKYEDDKKQLQKDAEAILIATDYTNSYIKWGGNCDSSERAQIRIVFVKEAEKQFLLMHRKEILKLANKLCLASIGE